MSKSLGNFVVLSEPAGRLAGGGRAIPHPADPLPQPHGFFRRRARAGRKSRWPPSIASSNAWSAPPPPTRTAAPRTSPSIPPGGALADELAKAPRILFRRQWTTTSTPRAPLRRSSICWPRLIARPTKRGSTPPTTTPSSKPSSKRRRYLRKLASISRHSRKAARGRPGRRPRRRGDRPASGRKRPGAQDQRFRARRRDSRRTERPGHPDRGHAFRRRLATRVSRSADC